MMRTHIILFLLLIAIANAQQYLRQQQQDAGEGDPSTTNQRRQLWFGGSSSEEEEEDTTNTEEENDTEPELSLDDKGVRDMVATLQGAANTYVRDRFFMENDPFMVYRLNHYNLTDSMGLLNGVCGQDDPLTTGFHFGWDGIEGLSGFHLDRLLLVPGTGTLIQAGRILTGSSLMNFSGMFDLKFATEGDLGLSDLHVGFYSKGCGMDRYQDVKGSIRTVDPYIQGAVAMSGQGSCGNVAVQQVNFLNDNKLTFGWDSLAVDLDLKTNLTNGMFNGFLDNLMDDAIDALASSALNAVMQRFGDEFEAILPKVESEVRQALLDAESHAPQVLLPLQAQVSWKQTRESFHDFTTSVASFIGFGDGA